VKVFDIDSGEDVGTFVAPRPQLGSNYSGLALSPDGSRLAIDAYGATYSSDGQMQDVLWSQVWVFEVATRKRLTVFKMPKGWMLFLTFSPNGRALACGFRGFADMGTGAMMVWDTADWQPVHTWALMGSYEDAAFSPDGRRLAAANHDHVKVWDLPSGHEVLILRGTTPRESDRPFNPRVAWSADGQRLAANHFDGTLSVWDATPRDTAEARAARRRAADLRAFAWHLDGLSLARRRGDDRAASWHRARLLLEEPPTPALRLERAALFAQAQRWTQAALDAGRAWAEFWAEP
jgi:WD40 repeat protein